MGSDTSDWVALRALLKTATMDAIKKSTWGV